MPTPSESYLNRLAERTFLKLWTIPNPFRSSGKELSDLIIVFGDDVVIFSDKAYTFNFNDNVMLDWSRWYRDAIEGSVKQLSGAMRRLSDPRTAVFLDGRAKERIPNVLPDPVSRRYHLVGIARPNLDPEVIPPGWRGLTYVDQPSSLPFQIGPLRVGKNIVHIFDGPTVDLLLKHLDTAPDFIGYLAARAETIGSSRNYAFLEHDLLAAAIENWVNGNGLTVAPPDLADIKAGLWSNYVNSEGAIRSAKQNARSLTIDNFIEHFHTEYIANRFLNTPHPNFIAHEQAMRLLAAESRFARRMIVDGLYDILGEENQECHWALSVPSPSTLGLRYVWLTYPEPPEDWPPEKFERLVDQELAYYMEVACAKFGDALIVGIAHPNRTARETVVVLKVFDGSDMTEADRLEALRLQDRLGSTDWQPQTYIHVP